MQDKDTVMEDQTTKHEDFMGGSILHTLSIKKVSSIVVLDVGISLVPTLAADQGRINDTQISDQPEEQLGVFSAATALADAARRRQSVVNVQTYTKRSRLVSTADVSTASELGSTAGVKAKELAKKVFEEEKAKFEAKQEQEKSDFETALELQKQLDER
ncbi:hypothetical protein Tco_0883766 [Tanacetum coccineum]